MEDVQIFFVYNMGLAQGEIMSPIMFSLYVNDFENYFIEHGVNDYQFGELPFSHDVC